MPTGKLVMPGGIDAHVHLTVTEEMLSGPRWCDDFHSGTKAAAAGGITVVGNMTFPRGKETLVEAMDREAAEAKRDAIVDVILHPVLPIPPHNLFPTSRSWRSRSQLPEVLHELRWVRDQS